MECASVAKMTGKDVMIKENVRVSYVLFSVLLIFAWGFAIQPAEAQSRQQLVFEVYAGGIHAVRAHVDVDLRKKNQYSISLDAKTRGFLAKLVPWEGRFESHGWRISKGKFRPRQHKSTSGWEEETEIKDYRYEKNGRFISLETTDEKGSTIEKTIDPAVTHGTTDTLSAALEVFQNYTKTGSCAGSSDVFDGKRRFKQIFSEVAQTHLEANKYNVYSGDVVECTVEVVPVAGEWSKKPRGWLSIQEQGRKKGTMPTVWLAQIGDDGPAVPVKIRVKTDYGTLFMHLVEYKGADTILVAQERGKE